MGRKASNPFASVEADFTHGITFYKSRCSAGVHVIANCGHLICGVCGLEWLKDKVSRVRCNQLSFHYSAQSFSVTERLILIFTLVCSYPLQNAIQATCPICRKAISTLPALDALVPLVAMDAMVEKWVKKKVESEEEGWEGYADWKDRKE